MHLCNEEIMYGIAYRCNNGCDSTVASTRSLFKFKVRPIGQALATETDTKPNFCGFSVSWDLADKLSRPILAAATSTLHSTIVTCHAFHKSRGWNKLAKLPFDSTGRLLSVLVFRCQAGIDEKGPKLINNSNVRPCLALPLSACAHQVR